MSINWSDILDFPPDRTTLADEGFGREAKPPMRTTDP